MEEGSFLIEMLPADNVSLNVCWSEYKNFFDKGNNIFNLLLVLLVMLFVVGEINLLYFPQFGTLFVFLAFGNIGK